MSLTRPLLTIAAVLALAAPALGAPGDCRLIRGATTPDDLGDDVSVCRQDVWIHQADIKAGNAAAIGQDTSPSWDTTRPTASVQSGAGGGYLNPAAVSQNVLSRSDPRATPTFRGTFTGNLDNIAATLYLFNPGRQTSPNQGAWIRLSIDGFVVYQSSAVDRTPLATAGNALQKTEFALTDIYDRMRALRIETGSETTHAVELQISGWFSANDNSVYVYDTTEAPAGLVFNLEPTSLNAFSTRIRVTG